MRSISRFPNPPSHERGVSRRTTSVAVRKILNALNLAIAEAVSGENRPPAEARLWPGEIAVILPVKQLAHACSVAERTVRALLAALSNVGVIARIQRLRVGELYLVGFSGKGRTDAFVPFVRVQELFSGVSTITGGTLLAQTARMLNEARILIKLMDDALLAAFHRQGEYLDLLAPLTGEHILELVQRLMDLPDGERGKLGQLEQEVAEFTRQIAERQCLDWRDVAPKDVRSRFNSGLREAVAIQGLVGDSVHDTLDLIYRLSLFLNSNNKNIFVDKNGGKGDTPPAKSFIPRRLDSQAESPKPDISSLKSMPTKRLRKTSDVRQGALDRPPLAKKIQWGGPDSDESELSRLLNAWGHAFETAYGWTRGFIQLAGCPAYVRDAMMAADRFISEYPGLEPLGVFAAVLGRYRLHHSGKAPSVKWLGTAEFLSSVHGVALIIGSFRRWKRELPESSDDLYVFEERWLKLVREAAAMLKLPDPMNVGGPELREYNQACLFQSWATCGQLQQKGVINVHLYPPQFLWANLKYARKFPFLNLEYLFGHRAALRAVQYAFDPDSWAFVNCERERAEPSEENREH